MEAMISDMLSRFERRGLTRRELVRGLSMLAASGGAAAAQGQDAGIKGVKIDHVSIQVSDLPRSIAMLTTDWSLGNETYEWRVMQWQLYVDFYWHQPFLDHIIGLPAGAAQSIAAPGPSQPPGARGGSCLRCDSVKLSPKPFVIQTVHRVIYWFRGGPDVRTPLRIRRGPDRCGGSGRSSR